ncbi:hypothetical protein BDW02DRAFT_135911 [Decorospora gaudefroyi]|uniref:Uncharacterized protein n=1 Tax=Decorospora gaudefroyi TaxID=184978 RepID=A0A6A5K5Q7_9PLEO|nr:hypothetical protein BDW02DRAFT_135911 [Decorospora gaudefroyi]
MSILFVANRTGSRSGSGFCVGVLLLVDEWMGMGMGMSGLGVWLLVWLVVMRICVWDRIGLDWITYGFVDDGLVGPGINYIDRIAVDGEIFYIFCCGWPASTKEGRKGCTNVQVVCGEWGLGDSSDILLCDNN